MAVDETLSELRSECELCGRWSGFTGRVEESERGPYHILDCPAGHGEFAVYDPGTMPLLQAYLASLTTLADPVGYRRAWQVLQRGGPAEVGALLDQPPAEMPLFRIEDVDVPEAQAGRWAELLRVYPGWRPEPTDALRLREQLATVVRFERLDLARAALAHLRPADAAATYDHLWRRFHARAEPLLPLLGGA